MVFFCPFHPADRGEEILSLIFSTDIHKYNSCLLYTSLEANGEQDDEKSGQSVYDVLAGQIENLKVEEDLCFDRVEAEFPGKIPGAGPQFDVEAREQFFLFTKQKNTVFRYVFANEDGEEASVLLEYLSY